MFTPDVWCIEKRGWSTVDGQMCSHSPAYACHWHPHMILLEWLTTKEGRHAALCLICEQSHGVSDSTRHHSCNSMTCHTPPF